MKNGLNQKAINTWFSGQGSASKTNSPQFKNNYLAEMYSGSEEGSYLRLTDGLNQKAINTWFSGEGSAFKTSQTVMLGRAEGGGPAS